MKTEAEVPPEQFRGLGVLRLPWPVLELNEYMVGTFLLPGKWSTCICLAPHCTGDRQT